jgi:hypothetical protein
MGNIRRKNEIEAAIARDRESDAAEEKSRMARYTVPNSQALQAAETLTKKFWNRALPDVHKNLTQTRTPSAQSWASAIIPQQQDDNIEDSLTLGVDYGVSLPTIAPAATAEEARARGEAEKKAWVEFSDHLTEKTGYTLSESGQARLVLYAMANARGRGADLTQTSSYAACFDRLVQLGAFADDEIGHDINLKTPDPEPAPVPYDIETADTQTRTGQRRAKEFLDERYYSGEVRALFNEWCASIESGFGFYGITDDVKKAAVGEFERRNLSFLSRQAYDEVRRILVRRGILPHTCLTRDELFAEAIENTTGSVGEYEARREFIQRSALLREQ